jgi:hypothetical protein
MRQRPIASAFQPFPTFSSPALAWRTLLFFAAISGALAAAPFTENRLGFCDGSSCGCGATAVPDACVAAPGKLFARLTCAADKWTVAVFLSSDCSNSIVSVTNDARVGCAPVEVPGIGSLSLAVDCAVITTLSYCLMALAAAIVIALFLWSFFGVLAHIVQGALLCLRTAWLAARLRGGLAQERARVAGEREVLLAKKVDVDAARRRQERLVQERARVAGEREVLLAKMVDVDAARRRQERLLAEKLAALQGGAAAQAAGAVEPSQLARYIDNMK